MAEKDKKKEKQQNKLAIIIVITVVMMAVLATVLWILSGAGKEPSQKVVFRVGDEKVYLDEVNLCILQNVVNLGLTAEMLDGTAQDGSSADDYYKSEILQVIMDYKVEAKIAQQQGISLTDEEMQSVRDDAAEYMGKVDGKILKKLGITRERVVQIYTERYLAHALEESVTRDITVDKQKYCTLYLLLFPKIETDENGDYVTDSSEIPIMLSDEEIEKKKEEADAAYEELLAGADIEQIADKYGVANVSGEERDFVDNFEEPFLGYAESLKEGEYSPVLEMPSCYAIVKMITENDEELADQILEYYKADLKKDTVNDSKSRWYEEAGISEEPDFAGNTWKAITLYDFVQYVEE